MAAYWMTIWKMPSANFTFAESTAFKILGRKALLNGILAITCMKNESKGDTQMGHSSSKLIKISRISDGVFLCSLGCGPQVHVVIKAISACNCWVLRRNNLVWRDISLEGERSMNEVPRLKEDCHSNAVSDLLLESLLQWLTGFFEIWINFERKGRFLDYPILRSNKC